MTFTDFCAHLSAGTVVRIDVENINHVIPTLVKQSADDKTPKTIGLIAICAKIKFTVVVGGKAIACEKIVNRKHLEISLFFDKLEMLGANLVFSVYAHRLLERDWANREWNQRRVDLVNKTDFNADFGKL